MASPLLPYANAYVKVTAKGAVTNVNGRFVSSSGNTYLVECFIKRQQYNGVSAGSVKQPLPSQLDGEMMPGASGDQYYYRGYALRYGVTAVDFDPSTDDLSTVTWTKVNTSYSWLLPGTSVDLYLGETPVMKANIERFSGVFGGTGIDQILYKELGGVQIQLTGAEVQD
jgi:hypothetical protein